LQHFQRFYSFGVDVCFTRIGDFTWRVSDCEELVWVTHRRWWGWPCEHYWYV